MLRGMPGNTAYAGEASRALVSDNAPWAADPGEVLQCETRVYSNDEWGVY